MGRSAKDLVVLRTVRRATNAQLARTKGNMRRGVERRTWDEFNEARENYELTHKIDWSFDPVPTVQERWYSPDVARDEQAYELTITYLLKPSLWTRIKRVFTKE